MNENLKNSAFDDGTEQQINRLVILKGATWYNDLLCKTQFDNETEKRIATALDMLSKLNAGRHTGSQSREESISAIRHRLKMLIDELENTSK